MKQTLYPVFLLFTFAAIPIGFCTTSNLNLITSNQRYAYLTVESTGWSAELFWNASFEKDLAAFYVQRSADGLEFQDIISYRRHFVAAGDTETMREQDNDPMPGENHYRIRFVFVDGEVYYSERKKVYFKEIPAFEIFPNPTGKQVNLLMKKFRGEPVEVLVFDGVGTQVYQQHIPAVDDGILRIELETMNPGVYSVSVLHNSHTFTRRLVVTSNENN